MTGYVAHTKNIKYNTDCIKIQNWGWDTDRQQYDLISLLTKIREDTQTDSKVIS
jgi:hypothetical protein